MNRVRVLPYKAGSRSAKALAEGLGVRRLKLTGSRFIPRRGDYIINWGNTATTTRVGGFSHFVNSPHAVAQAACKSTAFNRMLIAGVRTPEFTYSRAEAETWAEEGGTVVCRTLTRASSGRGIVLAREPIDVVPAPLYTKYVKKVREYRVHVFFNCVIDTQIKRRSREVSDERVDWQIRSHANGFVYCREDVQLDDRRDTMARAAVAALDLDFGAVDIIYNEQQDQYYVLEVNTAPGLEGSTLQSYIQAFNYLF